MSKPKASREVLRSMLGKANGKLAVAKHDFENAAAELEH